VDRDSDFKATGFYRKAKGEHSRNGLGSGEKRVTLEKRRIEGLERRKGGQFNTPLEIKTT